MAPTAYPTRVAWQFHNVTRSYDFWPTLESISIAESNPEDLAVMSGELVDEAGTITMGAEDEVWCKVDGTKVFAGHVKSITRAQLTEMGPRAYRFDCQDYTAKLDDSVIDHPGARGAESLADRVAWVLSFLNYAITTGGVSLPSETSERDEYDGMTVREALDQLSDAHRLFYYVDFDKDLHMFRSETISAPFSLDDAAPDYAASFPYREFEESRDSVELANAAYVIGEKGRTWVTDASSISTFGRQERAVSDPELVTATQRTRAGDRANAELSLPQFDGHLLCHEPGLRGGMSILLSNDLWGLDEVTRILTSVEMTAVDPHDEDGKAYLHTQVAFSDRRRARPRKARVARPTDPDVQDGSTLSVARWCLSKNHDGFDGVAINQYKSVPPVISFDGPDGSIHDYCEQGAYPGNVPYTESPCASGCGWWTGRQMSEQWFAFDPGTLSSGEVGVRFDLVMGSLARIGVGSTYGLVIGVGHAAPTDELQYEPFAYVPAADTSIVIPRSMLVASATNYLVVACAWVCDSGQMCAADINAAGGDGCDWTDGVLAVGIGNSGRVSVQKPVATLVSLSGSGLTSWVSGVGDVDGSNRAYTLYGWNGRGVPEARVDMAILAWPADYSYDDDAGTVTLAQAPPSGSNVAFRYRT